MKTKWIPRGEFFRLKAAGKLPPELQEKYSKPNKTKKTKRKRTKSRRVKARKTRRTSRKVRRTTGPKFKVLYNFTIYKNGEEVEVVQGYSPGKIEKEMQKKYKTKNILIAGEKA